MNDMVTNRKHILKILTGFKNSCTFEIIVPVLLPVRSAHGSFFFIGFTINEQHSYSPLVNVSIFSKTIS